MTKAIGVGSGFCVVKDVPDATRNAMRVGAMVYENLVMMIIRKQKLTVI